VKPSWETVIVVAWSLAAAVCFAIPIATLIRAY